MLLLNNAEKKKIEMIEIEIFFPTQLGDTASLFISFYICLKINGKE